MSTRTLQRKLLAHGTSYRRLLGAALRDRAEEALSEPSLAIAVVASRVGFSDPGNFSRAFRRWTGQSPRAFRRSIAGSARAQDDPIMARHREAVPSTGGERTKHREDEA